jgi:hypothetical protein
MTEAVREYVLDRMVQLYPPPTHLRGDEAQTNAALAEYERVLAPFDRETLARAWDKVVAEHSFWVWPNPGLFAEACRQFAPKPTAPSEKEQRRQQALELADHYTHRYMKMSHLAQLARAEGFEPELLAYVQAASWVQAQLIAGVRDIGWDSVLVPDAHAYGSAREAFAAYRQSIARTVEQGRISVRVPPSIVRAWKAECRRGPASPPDPARECGQEGRGR